MSPDKISRALRSTTNRSSSNIFCDISKTKLDSLSFADRLLSEGLVAVIPGEAFGRDDYIRISFAASIAELTKGLSRTAWILLSTSVKEINSASAR